MPERDVLTYPLGDAWQGWQVKAGGVARDREGQLVADVFLQNGVPVHSDRIALMRPEGRAAFGAAATAPNRPDAATIAEALMRLVPDALAQLQDQGGAGEGGGRRSQADRLVAYAEEAGVALFVDQYGTGHALADGKPLALTSAAYPWLRRLMWELEGRTATGEALGTAAGTLAAKALATGDRRELHVRSAWQDGAVTVHLGDDRAVTIRPGAWHLRSLSADSADSADVSPTLFRQYATTRPLPDPVDCADLRGALGGLGGLVNLRGGRNKRLYVAYLATTWLPHVARPILLATGPMGAGKTTLHRLTKRLLDPTAPESIRLDRDMLTKAAPAQVLLVDNASALPDWAADTLCRLCTGEGDAKRRLYTDDDTVVIELRRAILLNAINVPSDRADLLDRTLALELERIAEGKRRPERELWATVEREHGRWLGALCTLLAGALAVLPSLTFPSLPRLADWGEFAAAVYAAAGWEDGGLRGVDLFLRDWAGNVEVQQQATLDGSATAQTLLAFMEARDGDAYTGTPDELYRFLSAQADKLSLQTKGDPTWPKSSRTLWPRIQEVVPVLEAGGLSVTHQRSNGARRITLRKGAQNVGTVGTEADSGTTARKLSADPSADSADVGAA